MTGEYASRRRLDESRLWSEKRPLLTWLDVELTHRCGNRCAHCSVSLPADDRPALGRELAAGEWADLLDQAAGLGCLTVRLTGGEPLLRPDFESIYLAVRRRGMSVKLFTNATLISPRLAELFRRIPPREKIEVSLYGMSPPTYEAVSGVPGSFAAARTGIDRLRERDIPFVLKGAVLAGNRADLPELEAYAREAARMAKPPSLAFIFELSSRRDAKASARIAAHRWPVGEVAALLTRDLDAYLRDRREFLRRFGGPEGDVLFPCLSAGGKAAIDPYGLLQACLPLRHPDTVYDLRRGSLREAMEAFLPGLRRLRARNPAYLARCARCFLRNLCSQCPAKSWSEHGDLDTPVEYLCAIAHAEARLLGILKEGESAWTVASWRSRIDSAEGDA